MSELIIHYYSSFLKCESDWQCTDMGSIKRPHYIKLWSLSLFRKGKISLNWSIGKNTFQVLWSCWCNSRILHFKVAKLLAGFHAFLCALWISQSLLREAVFWVWFWISVLNGLCLYLVSCSAGPVESDSNGNVILIISASFWGRENSIKKLRVISKWIKSTGPKPGPQWLTHRAMGKHSSTLCLNLLSPLSQGDHEDKQCDVSDILRVAGGIKTFFYFHDWEYF